MLLSPSSRLIRGEKKIVCSSGRKWSEMVVERRKAKPIKRKPGERDYMDDLSQWERPRWERSPYFWVAITAWLTAVGVSLGFQS